MVIIVAAMLLLLAGCGPGQPFEIEGRVTLQSSATAKLASVR